MNCDRVSVPNKPDNWLNSGTESRWAFIPLSDISILGSEARSIHLEEILNIAFVENLALGKNADDDTWF